MEPAKSSSPVLALEEFTLATKGGGPTFSLHLKKGELAFVECSDRDPIQMLSDAALGILPFSHGRSLFQGKEWSKMDPHHADLQRLHIGRVLDSSHKAVWIENLDVDENVTLAQLFHPERERISLVEHARSIAGHCGLSAIPHTRPSATRPDLLQLSQWVRALLPNPLELLILERPFRGLSKEATQPLIRELTRARQNGTAILWLDNVSASKHLKDLNPTYHYQPLPESLYS